MITHRILTFSIYMIRRGSLKRRFYVNIIKKITLITCLFVLLGACQSKSVQNDKDNYVGEGIGNVESLIQQDLIPPIWQVAYDNSKLNKTVQEQIRRWSHNKGEIPYYIHSRLFGDNVDVVGLYRSIDDWELRGATVEDQTFILLSNEEKVILVYDEYEEELAKAEAAMLIPLNHLYIVEELLEGNEYEWIIWKEEEEGWSVTIRSSSDTLYSDFQDYIFPDTMEERAIGAEVLEGYYITYDLQLHRENDYYTIKSLHFSLEKRDTLLEELQFHF
jgi:hypothetical protein